MKSLKLQSSSDYNALTVIENTVKLLGLKISNTSLRAVEHLPDYPSLSSLAIAFKDWGVDTAAIKVKPEELIDVSLPAIAHINRNDGHFVLFTEINNHHLTYHDPEEGWKTETLQNFIPKWSGIILLLEASASAGDPEFVINKKAELLETTRINIGIGLGVLLVLSSFFLFETWTEFITGSLFLTGAVLSGLIIASDLGSKIAESICRIGKKIDCYNILNSPAATLFGWLKMSDIGLIWFTGSWLSMVTGALSGAQSAVLTGLSLLSFFAVAYVPFSIGYQWLKVKQWCSLCLGIQALLVADLILLFPFLNRLELFFTAPSAPYLITVGFALPALTWLWVKPLLKKSYEARNMKKELHQFKRDPDLFRTLLQNSDSVEVVPFLRDMKMGNDDAPFQITMATNLYCEPCGDAHRQLELLLEQDPDKLSVTVRFTVDPDNPADRTRKVAQHLLSLPENIRRKALRDWFRAGDYDRWALSHPVEIKEDTLNILRAHRSWCTRANVAHTPTLFLNGKRVPAQYTTEEVIFHLRHLKPVKMPEPQYQF